VLCRKPPIELVLLMAVGVIDLLSTVILYCMGLVVELNPLMRPLLEASPWLFSIVKLATLFVAYVAMQAYRKHDETFVRRAALGGATAYIIVWSACTLAGHTVMG
jgi:hypothetical protein